MRKKNKVFEIGVMKTGTTSLGVAFQILGYKACSWHPKAAAKFSSTQNFNVLKPYINRFDAFDDGPWHDCRFEDIDEHYPESKFIILERDNEGWIRSMEQHQSPEYNVNKINPRYLRNRWVTDRDAYIQYLLNWKKEKYDRINEYFKDRPDDLLTFNITDGWSPLCSFLEKPIPDKPFPRKNVSRSRFGAGFLRNLSIPKF